MAESDIKLIDENGNPFEVPVDGSLGLLALGHQGLELWRKKRESEGIDVKAMIKEIYEKEEAEKEKRMAEFKAKLKEKKEKKEGDDNG